jgi:hypothetical protein
MKNVFWGVRLSVLAGFYTRHYEDVFCCEVVYSGWFFTLMATKIVFWGVSL